MIYSYRTVRIERGAWPRVGAALADAYGVWRGEIGWYSDEGALMTAGPMPDGVEGVISLQERRLEATVRPAEPTPPREDGIYAHRWFEVAPGDFDEFCELSAGAWPDFESTYGVRVVGLWRDVDAPEQLLLITRYPSLAVWETSRPHAPGPGAQEARRRFARRAEITLRTGVRIGRLVPGLSANAV